MKKRTKALFLGALSLHIIKAVVFTYAANAWWGVMTMAIIWRGGW